MPMSLRTVRRLLVSLTLSLSTSACKPPPPPPPPPAPAPAPAPPTVEETATQIFAAYFAAHPVTATSMGEHAYDGQWPDVTAAGIEAERARIDAARTALGAAQLRTVGDEVDAEILLNDLERQTFVLDVEQPWARDPYWYANVMGSGIDDLISRDFAPIEERAASLAARLTALPAFIEQAKANLDPGNCMLPQTQVAIGQLDGMVDLVRKTVIDRLATAPEEARLQVGSTTGPAVQAIRDFQQHLRTQVLPQAAGAWRLGSENFDRKLRLTLNTDIAADELRRQAVLEHGRVRQQMTVVAGELAEVMFGARKLRRIRRRAKGNADAAVTRAVLEALSDWHVSPEALRGAIELNLVRLDEFVRAQDVVPLDDSEVLEVIWTPPHQRGVFIAGLAPPGPLETGTTGLPSFYLVQPIPADWSPEVSDSFLREYNNFMLEILSIHEAIPGHFVQLYYGKREPSSVRRVLQNGAFVEGWAVYTESVMVEAGYAGIGPSADIARPASIAKGLWAVMASPELRAKAIALHGLKFYLRTVTNAVLDHSIHAGTMTREEALELMIERSFQQEGEALGKWTRAQLSSTQLSTYFVGAQAWKALREQAEARAAERSETFSSSQFHAEALGHGAPPVHALPRLLGWTAPKTAGLAPAGATAEASSEQPLGGTAETVTDEPVADEPATDEPVADEPVADELVTDEPVTDEPVADESAVDDLDGALEDVLGE